MNICFLSLIDISTIDSHGIYEDLLREFYKHGHKVYVVSPSERRKKENTHLITTEKVVILKIKTGNIQKTQPSTERSLNI